MLEFWATRGMASVEIASPNRTTRTEGAKAPLILDLIRGPKGPRFHVRCSVGEAPAADCATVEAHGFSRAKTRPNKSWASAPENKITLQLLPLPRTIPRCRLRHRGSARLQPCDKSPLNLGL